MSDQIIETYHYSAHVDELTIKRTQDVSDILKHNAEVRRENQISSFNPHKHAFLNPVAEIPINVIAQWLQEDPPLNMFLVGSDPDHTKRFRQKMNDNAYRDLRLSNTRI